MAEWLSGGCRKPRSLTRQHEGKVVVCPSTWALRVCLSATHCGQRRVCSLSVWLACFFALPRSYTAIQLHRVLYFSVFAYPSLPRCPNCVCVGVCARVRDVNLCVHACLYRCLTFACVHIPARLCACILCARSHVHVCMCACVCVHECLPVSS